MWPCMKLRHIEELLQGLQEFEKPKIVLEQYVTPPHLASHILYTIQSQHGDIEGKLVGDLGCGCGALTIGAAVMGASVAYGFEIDADALGIFSDNIAEQEINNVEAIQCDVTQEVENKFLNYFDTIIMNPPFGTKNNPGMDVKFLERAFKLSNKSVYSLHKTSTREHILKMAKQNGVQCEVLAELRYDLPHSYKFHKKSSVDIFVDFIKFDVSNVVL